MNVSGNYSSVYDPKVTDCLKLTPTNDISNWAVCQWEIPPTNIFLITVIVPRK